MKKIIVAEDELAIREFIVINLERAGYNVTECDDGLAAWNILEKNDFDFEIAILDVMMPGMNGMELCKNIRKRSKTMGIIILTAKSQEMDKISGLMHGADDYVVKPFSPSELIARIDALYRRVAINSQREENKLRETVEAGDFSLNLVRRSLTKKDKVIELSIIEFQIMEYFLSNPNQILSREDILNHVWGQNDNKKEMEKDKIIDVNIRRLRMKIEDNPSHPEHIMTIWGSGYKWEN